MIETNTMIYQVSTLQALALGYSRAVITVGELLEHGDMGLGTFEDVNGEMIVVDGVCHRADEEGNVWKAEPEMGVPFASVAKTDNSPGIEISDIPNIEKLKELLTVKIEEDFGLNSMHIARVDGSFARVCARSESPYRSHHVDLKDILSKTQKDFVFENIEGTMVCIYYPDYMDGINAPGWHIHFLSQDMTKGGHVFDMEITSGCIQLTKLDKIQIQLPNEPAFDTYSLKEASGSDIKKVEQGNGRDD